MDEVFLRIVIFLIVGFVSFPVKAQDLPDLAGQLSEKRVSDFARDVCGYHVGDEEVIVPYGVKEIPAFAFAGAKGLRRVLLPDDIETIGAHAFAYCASLEEVRLPGSLKYIRQCAFVLCESLSEIEIPEGVVEMESYAFAQCASLRRAVLPANGSMLGELIFSCCDSLEEIVEMSEVVPMYDCGSTLFDADDEEAWERCVLIVSENRIDEYRQAPGWKLFKNITACPT